MKLTSTQTREFKEMLDQLAKFQDLVVGIRGDWEDQFEEKSEDWQESDAGQEAQTQIGALEELDSAIEGLKEAIQDTQ